MQYRQDMVRRMPIMQVELYLNSNHTKYFQRKFAILVATPTDVTMTPLVRCKAHHIL